MSFRSAQKELWSLPGLRSIRWMTQTGRRVQRWIGGLLLACMATLVVGIPLPMPGHKPVTGEAFPCQDSPCGCASAAQCWDKCCCNDDQEKLAWAEANGVAPPDFLIQRVARAQAAEGAAASLATCCQTQAKKPSCCSPRREKATAEGATCQQPGTCESEVEGAGVRIVLLDALYRCKGIELAIQLLSETVVDWGRAPLAIMQPFLLYALMNGDEFGESFCGSLDPPIP